MLYFIGNPWEIPIKKVDEYDELELSPFQEGLDIRQMAKRIVFRIRSGDLSISQSNPARIGRLRNSKKGPRLR